MLIFNQKAALSDHLDTVATQNKTIGFVPTMGALHQGHLSLLERSLQENDITVISIFVNPTQFNNTDDLKKYPRTLEADVAKIQALNPGVIIFAPSVDDMYEGHTVSAHFSFDGLENQMEGAHRPGHFDGVGTIVKKLFEIVRPTNAYFGEKDFQQLQIVKKMAEKEQLPVNVIGCPILREANGLAMSSRNERLTDEEREQASFIYKSLQQARTDFENAGIEQAKANLIASYKTHPEFELEYFEIAAEDDLIPATTREDRQYRGFIAVHIGGVRLIDNIPLN